MVISNLVERGIALAKIEKHKYHKPNQFIPFLGATNSEGRIDPLLSHHMILAHPFFGVHRDVHLYNRQFKVLPGVIEC